jgi:hypothetical protein
MNVYVSIDGDGIGALVGRARLNDDVETVRKISTSIDLGNRIWSSWALASGGSVVEMGGDEIALEIPADRIGELPALRDQYSDKVGATVSVGVGMKLSDSSKALLAAKLKGKDQIVFYSEECDALIEKAKENPQSEAAKIADEYLNKAAPAMNDGAGAGFVGATRPSAPSVVKPVATQGDSNEMDAMNGVLGDENAPAAAERTHAAHDFEKQLHDEAWKGEEEDMAGDSQKQARLDQVKQQVVQALQALKLQAPLLEQVKQASPQAYQAMVGLTQAVVGMARELAPQQPEQTQKSEIRYGQDMAKADKTAKTVDQVRSVLSDDLLKPEYRGSKHCMKGHCYVASEALYHLLGGKEAGWIPHTIQHEGGPHWYLKHSGGRVLDPTADQFNTPVPYEKGTGKGFLTKVPSARTRQVIERMLGEGSLKPKQAATIDSAPLEKAGKDPKKALKAPTAAQREELVHYSVKPGLKTVAVNRMGTGAPSSEYKQGIPEVARAYYYRAGSKPEPLVTQGAKAAYKATLDPSHRLYDIGADPEGLREPSRQRFLAGEGLNSPDDTFLDTVKSKGYYGYHNSKSALPHVVALFHSHPVQEVKKEEMTKGGLPMPGASAHHHLNLPSGSLLNGKIKVTHSDGKQSWKQIEAGQIRSMDPAGHPTSSRSPNSK